MRHGKSKKKFVCLRCGELYVRGAMTKVAGGFVCSGDLLAFFAGEPVGVQKFPRLPGDRLDFKGLLQTAPLVDEISGNPAKSWKDLCEENVPDRGPVPLSKWLDALWRSSPRFKDWVRRKVNLSKCDENSETLRRLQILDIFREGQRGWSTEPSILEREDLPEGYGVVVGKRGGALKVSVPSEKQAKKLPTLDEIDFPYETGTVTAVEKIIEAKTESADAA